LLCFNGSAPLRPTRNWFFRVPGIAFVKSLLQVVQILNANTVLPRIDAIRSVRECRHRGAGRDTLDSVDLIADLRTIEENVKDYLFGAWGEEQIREIDPSVSEWERAALSRIRLARKFVAKKPDTNWLDYLLGESEPTGAYPVCGLANLDDLDALEGSGVWKSFHDDDPHRVDAPTTLDRIEPGLARRLIARGYLNTYLVSLFLAPLADGDIDRLATLRSRLNKIVGLKDQGQNKEDRQRFPV
jgi:hypothetical protein